ncbi:MAG: branched-chain amino acid aminotransferase, partial [Oscillospiraceae bacterium]
MDIKMIKATNFKAKPTEEKTLGFGKTFSDYMFIMEYTVKDGWHDARIQPYQPLTIDPASPVLHYGQEIFEGLKAYRRVDGKIGMFRPEENAARMNRSAERMCMPQIPVDMQVQAMKALVDVEREWVPHSDGTSLYLRPTMIADGSTLGVHAAPRYIYFIICAPSGAYYANGLAPVRIYIEDGYVRAVEGGTGEAKCGGNYAASMKGALVAEEKGYDQVLWLDGRQNRYIEEVGAMNVMFVIGGKLVTPKLHGSILPGITRKSILEVGRDMGLVVEERPIDVQELVEAYKAGTMTEAFGTGTAAVISPIGEMAYKDTIMKFGDGKTIGPVSQKMYDTLTGIQWGRVADSH